MLGRLRRPADFEAVLATPIMARSAHFAAHFLSGCPASPRQRLTSADKVKLSTGDAEHCPQAVDDSGAGAPTAWWIGVVVPKRHARKATTRNLLRRQMRGAFERHRAVLERGMWLLRLRTAFDARQFTSAAPALLRRAARSELDTLLMRVAQ